MILDSSMIAARMKELEQLKKENAKIREALLAWHEYFDDRYDGQPLKEHELKMLQALESLKEAGSV